MMKAYQSLSPAWKERLPYIALILVSYIAYINVYDNAFLFDDGLLITLNQYLRHWDTLGDMLTASTTEGAHIHGGFYRPMQNILYFIIFQIGGETKFGFHFLNVSIHVANVCLMYTLGQKLKFDAWPTFLASLLWAVHPLQTEAVTYMSATADVLFAFFLLLGAVTLLPDFTPRKIAISIGILFLGLMSKETMIVFPAMAMVCMYYVSERRLNLKTYLPTWPIWIIVLAYFAWRMTTKNLDGPQTYERLYQMEQYHNLKLYADNIDFRFYTFFATLPVYLGMLLWPIHLHMERVFKIYTEFTSPLCFSGFLILTAAVIYVICARGKKALPLAWGILWFGASHFPDTGLIVPMNALLLEHWMYVPTIGLFLGGAQTIYLCLRNANFEKLRMTLAGVTVALSYVCGVMTLQQNMIWHDPFVFYSNIFKYGENSARAHNNLALAYVDAGDYEHAIEEFNEAIRVSDTYAETHHNLALSILRLPDQQKHIPEAIDQLNRALEIDPNFVRSYVALASLYGSLGDKEKADYYGQKAVALMNRIHPE